METETPDGGVSKTQNNPAFILATNLAPLGHVHCLGALYPFLVATLAHRVLVLQFPEVGLVLVAEPDRPAPGVQSFVHHVEARRATVTKAREWFVWLLAHASADAFRRSYRLDMIS